ncbi:MAG: RpoL/Rpb11 RNA polymerase subunit family protein [Promethearchaeota archaeon]
MAKKKNAKPLEENIEDIDDFNDEDFEDDEIEIAIPKIGKKTKEEKISAEPLEEKIAPAEVKKEEIEGEAEEEEEEEEEEIDYGIVEEPVSYKYIDLKINKGVKEGDYELFVEGQSHGFCNIFIKHLLDVKGVNIAAYKITGLEPPKIFIRLDNGYKIKDILYKAVENLRNEVKEVQKVFEKLL